jgi:hypothetical protein
MLEEKYTTLRTAIKKENDDDMETNKKSKGD